MRSIEKNIKVDILYRIFSNLDFTSAIWVLYLSSKGISLVKIGILESIFHITSFICETPTGAIADLLGRRNTLVMGRLMAFVSSIIMLISNSFLGFALGFVFSALSFNLNSGSEEALIYDTLKELEKEKEYSSIISKLNVVIEVASGIAVFIGG
ncbi:MFS transporter, partial [Clostridium ihumii]|uniref:MFS transporter n=1 Tax=Clostridium ihumii TaxID=1470356 RepID=UPI00058CEAB9